MLIMEYFLLESFDSIQNRKKLGFLHKKKMLWIFIL